MKKILLILLTYTAGCLMVNAQITADKVSGCAPLTGVQFSSPVAGSWDFGDGGTGTGTNPQASFSSPGIYNVVFTPDGGGAQENLEISVFGKPSAAFTLNETTGCPNFSATFTDASTPYEGSTITDWTWDFGDGSIGNGQNPSHTYTATGAYSVTLTITDDNTCDTAIVAVDVIELKSPPTASFTASPTTSCTAPLNVAITNNSTNGSGGTDNLSYTWDFGDGGFSSSANPGSRTYNSEGVYALKLTVSEDGGCDRELSRSISIGNPEAIIDVPDTICFGVQTKFQHTSTGGSSFRWNFDDGGTTTNPSPNYSFSTPGNHTVELIASASGCSDTTEKSLFVQQITPTISAEPTYQCGKPYCVQFTGGGENITSWNYSFNQGGSSNEQNPLHCYTYFSDDPYAVNYENASFPNTTSLRGISVHGCYGDVSITDTIHPLKPNFAPNITQGCVPLEVVFSDSTNTGSPIVSYQYDFGDGSVSSDENPTHTFTTPGEYIVTLDVENANGCADTSFPITIYVGDTVNIDLTVSPTEVCIGDTVTITDATGNPNIDRYHFSTDENRGSEACPSDSIQQWSFFHTTGLHDVTFFADYNGCISEKIFSDAITVKGPSSEFNWSGNCENPTNITFTATTSEIDSLYWYFGDDVDSVLFSDNLNDTVAIHNYDTTGNYTVTLITTNSTSGCPNDTSSKIVNVRMLEAIIDAPTIVCTGPFIPSGANSKDVYGFCDNAYRWDFGDGSPIYLSNNPTFPNVFSDTGSYTVRLMVYDINGCRDTTEHQFSVTDLYAGFDQDTTTGCIPLTINFEDTSWSSSKIINWEWQFGNDSIDSSGAIVSNTYENYDLSQYNVLLIVQDSLGCIDTATGTINPIIPDSTFSVNDRTICEGDEVTFTLNNPNSIQSADWTFDNQGTADSLTPRFIFANEGNYAITVEVTDTNGCVAQNTVSSYVLVDAYPDAFLTIDKNIGEEYCAPQTFRFTDSTEFNSITTYGSRTWNLDNGNSSIVNKNPVGGTYSTPGIYNPQLIVQSSNGCRDTSSISITIIGPEGDFDMDKSIVCLGDSVEFTIKDTVNISSFTWDFNDGRTVASTSPVSHAFTTFPSGAVQTISLDLIGQKSGCPISVEKTLNIHQVHADFSFADSTVCLNTDVEFTSLSASTTNTTFYWDFGNGTNFSAEDPAPQSYSNMDPGTYVVTLIVEDANIGCKDTISKNLEILALPSVESNDTVVCDGESTVIYASGADSYSWDNSVLLESPDSAVTVVNITEDTSFTVTGTQPVITVDTSFCSNTSTSMVSIVREIDAEDVKVNCVIIGQSLSFGPDSLPGGYTYDWSKGPTDYLKCLDCARQNLIINDGVDSLVYKVEVSDPSNCFPKISSYQICVRENYTLDVPSAFTPNGTEPNDVVFINGHGIDRLVFFRIYNRWGEMVFETQDINVGWDGTYKGDAQDMETYIYQARAIMLDGNTLETGGEIVLIR